MQWCTLLLDTSNGTTEAVEVDDDDAVAEDTTTCRRITAKGTSQTIIVSDIHLAGTLSRPCPTRQDRPGESRKNDPKTRNCCEDADVDVAIALAVLL